MTTAEQLEALVWRAINDGWKPATEISYEGQIRIRDVDLSVFSYDDLGEQRTGYYRYSVNDILFNHDFARALFPKGKYIYGQLIPNDHEADPPILQQQGYYRWFTPADVNKSYCMVTTLIELDAADYHLQQAVILPTDAEKIGYMYRVVFGDNSPSKTGVVL